MPPMTFEQAVALGVSHHHAGRLEQAEQVYRQILQAQPRHAEVLHLLGALAYQMQRYPLAIEMIGKSIEVNPARPQAHKDLGRAHLASGQYDNAVIAFREALAQRPDWAEAHFNLGVALQFLGQVEAAIFHFGEVLRLRPDDSEALNNLAMAQLALGRTDESLKNLDTAAKLRPQEVKILYNLALAATQAEQADRAIAAYHAVLQIDPAHAAARSGLVSLQVYHGAQLLEKGDRRGAVAAFEAALKLDPESADAISHLAGALALDGESEQAEAHYRRAIALKPRDAAIHLNLGNVLKDQGRLDEALDCFRHAIEIAPQCQLCYANLLYTLHFHPAYSADAILAEHVRWREVQADPLQADPLQADPLQADPLQPGGKQHANDRSPDRRLRIGYISPDFRDHVVGRNVLPLIRNHNHQQFEIICYSNLARGDVVTKSFRASADEWRDVFNLSDQELAERIEQDRIDILVDLTLHMRGGRQLTFARKPAPIQVTFAGYPGTTGQTAIDYRLTDPHLDPPGVTDRFYSERSLRLSDSFWCYDPLGDPWQVSPLPAISNRFITFGCLNNFCKVNDGVLEVWGRVLSGVPGSRLVMVSDRGPHRQRTLDTLARFGADPRQVRFEPRRSREQYLQLYHEIDIALDTFPYNGHTTSLDAMWMGVPTVTMVGQTAVGRAGLSQASNVGLTELVAYSPEQFVAIATGLAVDLPRLVELRRTLRPRMESSPLMDAPRFARSIEKVYRDMWLAWTAQR